MCNQLGCIDTNIQDLPGWTLVSFASNQIECVRNIHKIHLFMPINNCDNNTVLE